MLENNFHTKQCFHHIQWIIVGKLQGSFAWEQGWVHCASLIHTSRSTKCRAIGQTNGAYDAVTHCDSVFQTVPLAMEWFSLSPFITSPANPQKGIPSIKHFCEEQYVQENNEVAIKRTCCV